MEYADHMSVFLLQDEESGARNGRVPTRGTAGSVGYDIYAAEGGVVPARGTLLVGTGLAVILPRGTYGRIAPRSGLAAKHSIGVGGGVIDPDYRGELKVVLFNHGKEEFSVRRGDRIAQLILEKCVICEVASYRQPPPPTNGSGGRGCAGFGSTGTS